MTDPEILLCGAAGTGKTLARLVKMNDDAWKYPGSRHLIVRKVRADLAQSTLVTFERDVLGVNNPICAGVQREHRQVYRYPNGSEIVVGGMDRPGKILSSDYDSIYPAEAVQFEENDWETFIMRLRTGVMPHQQLIADTNPDKPDHWLKRRCDNGQTILLNTYHQDNPAFWDAEKGEWTARGLAYVQGKLQRLTGVRRARYLENQWITADGAVYEGWNESIHVIDRFDIPESWRRIRAVDFGFTNPFVCLWIAVDNDGRAYVYREIYRTKRRVEEHAAQIRRLTGSERIEVTVADHDAEDRDTLHAHGVSTIKAKKDISPGIQALASRLQVQSDGKPRLFIFRDALVEQDEELIDGDTGRHVAPLSTREEFGGYVWAKAADGKPNKEVPVDVDNHGLDALRYAVMYLDHGRNEGTVSRNPFYR